MAGGRLGAGSMGINAWTEIYECPENKQYASIKVHVINRNANECYIDIALSTGDGVTVNTDEYLEYQTMIVGHGSIERSGLIVSNGTKVMTRSSNGDSTTIVHGIEVDDPTAQPSNP